jgi:hypothetical protein
MIGAAWLAIQPIASAQMATPPSPPKPGDPAAQYSPDGRFSVVEAVKAYGSAGSDAFVFRSSDGKCIGSVITEELTNKATAAFKRLDSRIRDKMLVKRIVEFKGWTKEGVLKVEVYTRYVIRVSENEGESHGEEAQFTYHGNMNVEGSKLVLVDGKAEEGHRIW